METLSVRDYRNNLSANFDRADKGEKVLIRRKNQIYVLMTIGREDITLTPELKARIEEAEKACKEGRYVSCSTPKEIENFINSL